MFKYAIVNQMSAPCLFQHEISRNLAYCENRLSDQRSAKPKVDVVHHRFPVFQANIWRYIKLNSC